MGLLKKSSKLLTVLVVAGLAAVGWFIFKPDSNKTPPATQPITNQATQTGSTQEAAGAAKLTTIETANFKYEKPANWVEVSADALKPSGSASGIGRITAPVASFFIKESDAVPKNNDEIKDSVLDAPKLLQNFKLISSEDTKISDQNGLKLTYSFIDNTGSKVTQQTNVIIYKKKSFFLQFKSPEADYDKQVAEFKTILDSFKFK